jgi:hypothetical protein
VGGCQAVAVRQSDQLGIGVDTLAGLARKPWLALPAAARPDYARLWSMVSHLFPEGGLPITAALAVWIESHGLAAEDAALVLRMLTSPGRVGGFKFGSDLTAALAALAAEAIRRRRDQAEADERRRAAADAAARGPVDLRELLDIDNLFKSEV